MFEPKVRIAAAASSSVPESGDKFYRRRIDYRIPRRLAIYYRVSEEGSTR